MLLTSDMTVGALASNGFEGTVEQTGSKKSYQWPNLDTSHSVREDKQESIALLPQRVGEEHVQGLLHVMFAVVMQLSVGFGPSTEGDMMGLDWSLNWVLIVATFSMKKKGSKAVSWEVWGCILETSILSTSNWEEVPRQTQGKVERL